MCHTRPSPNLISRPTCQVLYVFHFCFAASKMWGNPNILLNLSSEADHGLDSEDQRLCHVHPLCEDHARWCPRACLCVIALFWQRQKVRLLWTLSPPHIAQGKKENNHTSKDGLTCTYTYTHAQRRVDEIHSALLFFPSHALFICLIWPVSPPTPYWALIVALISEHQAGGKEGMVTA